MTPVFEKTLQHAAPRRENPHERDQKNQKGENGQYQIIGKLRGLPQYVVVVGFPQDSPYQFGGRDAAELPEVAHRTDLR